MQLCHERRAEHAEDWPMQVAYDQAFDLPPVQKDMGFLRQCYVLASICHFVYSFKQSDVGNVSNIELRLAGLFHDTASASAELLHFRYFAIARQQCIGVELDCWTCYPPDITHEMHVKSLAGMSKYLVCMLLILSSDQHKDGFCVFHWI